jgi:sugar phosphate isomerase/epimerase
VKSLRDRIGFDAGSTPLEEALDTAATHAFHYLDFNADVGANRLDQWSAQRARGIRDVCRRHSVGLTLHTMSGVNVAELSPFVDEAVDRYLRANIDLARRLGCGSVVVHGGYHFSSAVEARQAASLERLRRAVTYAEGVGGPVLLLENLNFEPFDAEVHYLAHTVEECRLYFDAISSARFGWAFTVNHAHLVPEDIDGFLDAFGVGRIGEVRLADNLGQKEVHLNPGEGNIDFASVFHRLESSGFGGYYTMAFGSLQDKLEARESLARYGP